MTCASLTTGIFLTLHAGQIFLPPLYRQSTAIYLLALLTAGRPDKNRIAMEAVL